MSDNVNGYCSWCFRKTDHRLFQKSYLARAVYRCGTCRNLSLKCRFCENMAAGPPNPDDRVRLKETFWKSIAGDYHNELCAEHDGTVASFESLTLKLDDIEDYHALFNRKRYNLLQAGKTAGAVIGGVLIIAPAAFLAAPGVAAALGSAGVLGAAGTGTAIVTLHGAALSSASLAAIGGGTVLGGTLVVTAAGTALGGALGGVISNQYFGEVRDFTIEKHNEGSKRPAIILVNGFLTENMSDTREWKKGLRNRHLESPWYHIRWESKTLKSLGALFLRDASGLAAKEFSKSLAKRAARKAGSRLNPLAWAAIAADFLGNPWYVAMAKASMTGVLLADILSRTRGQQFVLMGHSLGARVIYYALQALATMDRPVVRDAYLLGGAVGVGRDGSWDAATKAVTGHIHNCYSRNDMILRFLYQGGNALMSKPIGIRPIRSSSRKIKNWHFSGIVNGHNDWKANLRVILERINGA